MKPQKINIDTKMITLIGTPLSQSFAARMQNAGYKAAGLNYMYFYTEADSTHLKEIIDGIRYMPSFAGCAVTKPNKVAVMEYLDELDPLCKKIGSCNTVLKTPEGKLRGYNTDALGFYRSLVENGKMEAAGKSFFCFGAGGVGRAICCILADKGAEKVYITDIYPEAAEELAADINGFVPEEKRPVAVVVPHGVHDQVTECDCVINASGIGFGSTVGKSPVSADYLRKGQLCFDACYNPPETKFLQMAKSRGLKTLNGLWMSLFQGVAQVELWTGKEAPIQAMRDELITIMSSQK